jgi:dTDP-4-dehydrorhamnose reductase
VRSAVLGYTGLVGSHLSAVIEDAVKINRSNIDTLRQEPYEWLFISAMPAEKWKANKFPDEDLATLTSLQSAIATACAKNVVLISTVDVFGQAVGVDEDSQPIPTDQNVYGRNRLELERFVESKFEKTWVIRLPALISPRLKKNLLFDLRNGKSTTQIPINSSFQFYPLSRIGGDLSIARESNSGTYHFSAHPVTVDDLAKEFSIDERAFGDASPSAPQYDLRTKHAGLWGMMGDYIVSKGESVKSIEGYLN